MNVNQQQNMLQQFFEQQSSINGFPGVGFQPNQQMPSSYNGPTTGSNPFMTNANFRQQNGMSNNRFGSNSVSGESESFDMQSPQNTQSQQQGFPNFMDPRMSSFDPRSRPNFNPNGMMPGLDGFSGNSSYPAKMRMNEMAAMFGDPAAMAIQRQRMSMFGQGRENDFMSPTNPFGGFNPQQAAQLMQQQRFAAAFQRQVQEQMAAQQQIAANARGTDVTRQFPSSVSNHSGRQSTGSESSFNQNSQNSTQENFPSGFAQQNRLPGQPTSENVTSELPAVQTGKEQRNAGGTAAPTNNQINNASTPNKYPTPGSGNNTPRPPFDQGNESQRNAAMLAAAAVRAAAAASTRGRGGFPTPNTGGINNYPFGPRGLNTTTDQMPSPFSTQVLQSPDFGGLMSPNKDLPVMNLSPMSQGRGTPRSGNPPPYSPMSHSNDSNHSGSGSVKGSFSNLTNIPKLGSQIKTEETNLAAANTTNDNIKNDLSTESKSGNAMAKENVAAEVNHVGNDRGALMVAGSATKLSAPPTPMSVLSTSSPAPSPFQEDLDIDNLSPSWPQTPLSPNTQKQLKACASPRHFDQLSTVYELIDDDEKRNFLDRYLAFMSVNGTPVTKVPIIGKQPLDLYTLFRAVCERGGIQEVMEKHRFKEILTCLNLPSNHGMLAYMVKGQYMKYLHAYELKAKDMLLKQWKSTITLPNEVKQEAGVPTIALSAFNSVMNDMKASVNNTVQSNSNTSMQGWNQNSYTANSVGNNTSMATSLPSSQFGPRMSYSNQANQSPGLPPYGQPGMPGYGSGQEMPPGYPGGYASYQNPMFPRGPMQNYNSMRPNDGMYPDWPRVFSPRQGPPELFPEGLQRMSWNQQSQRHPISAFATQNYQVGKQMPPISRDSIEQMKQYNAQQQQMKMQQFHRQQQQQQQQQRFNQPDATVKAPKGKHVNMSDVKASLMPGHSSKREFSFPADCVEGIKPVLKKRKKLTSKDLGPVEAWRIMMSLKSGLVAECTWAIDTLNILLSDNNTITYFHLNQLPGLLDTLMDHYRRSLGNLFNTFKDMEIPLLADCENSNSNECSTADQKLTELWVGVCRNAKNSYTSNITSISILKNIQENLEGGKEFWERGGGDSTTHIQTSFPTKDIKLKAFPEGLSYVTKVDEEKKRKLEFFKNYQEGNMSLKSPANSDIDDNIWDSLKSPKNDKIANVSSTNESDKTNKIKSDENKELGTVCLGVLKDLLLDCEKEDISKEDEDPLVQKLLKDLEFNIPCDRKYLEDSREFISYLSRRLKRENRGNVESEQCVVKQSTPFIGLPECEQSLLRRCVALSNIFRSLSFIQGNDTQLAGHVGLLLITGNILLHKHDHAVTDHSQFKLGLDERSVVNNAISVNTDEWWRDSFFAIRENTLVLLSNIGGHLNLSRVKENVHRPLINGLLHWLVCNSSEALDPMPTAPGSHALSAHRLAMETLAKLTINSANIDLVVSCPPESRLEEIGDVLVKQIARKHPIPSREFAIILLDNLAQSEQFSKVLAGRKSAISNLVKFVYEAEKNTSNYLSSGGRVQPGLNAEDICGTSISLLRRSVNILLSVSKLPCNRRTLTPYTDDLLALSTSQMIDTSVLALLAEVLFELTA